MVERGIPFFVSDNETPMLGFGDGMSASDARVSKC